MDGMILRQQVMVSREARTKIEIQDTLSFVEDGDFTREFRECGLDDDDLELIQEAITICPTGGEVVPVSENIRDLFFLKNGEHTAIRYVYLEVAHTVLLVTAYPSRESFPLTIDEAATAEDYIRRQQDVFSVRYTR